MGNITDSSLLFALWECKYACMVMQVVESS
jgi:hypothetical protein